MALSDNFILSHVQAKHPIVLHGSSGTGKTSMVLDFAKRHGYECRIWNVSNIVALDLGVPDKNVEDNCLDYYIPRFLKELCASDCKPTIFFLDEFNRNNDDQVFNKIMELMLSRTIFNTFKLSDNVSIITSHDALLRRATHALHSPSVMEASTHMKFPLASQILSTNEASAVYKPKTDHSEVLKTLNDIAARQLDAVVNVLSTEAGQTLSADEVYKLFTWNCGDISGPILNGVYKDIISKNKSNLPTKLKGNYAQVSEFESAGHINEVVSWLSIVAKKESEHVADYLLTKALPETLRAMAHVVKFKKDVVLDWTFVAFSTGKLGIEKS
jgi:ATPase family associated with various cellular activities (AAA)